MVEVVVIDYVCERVARIDGRNRGHMWSGRRVSRPGVCIIHLMATLNSVSVWLTSYDSVVQRLPKQCESRLFIAILEDVLAGGATYSPAASLLSHSCCWRGTVFLHWRSQLDGSVRLRGSSWSANPGWIVARLQGVTVVACFVAISSGHHVNILWSFVSRHSPKSHCKDVDWNTVSCRRRKIVIRP